MSQTFTTNTLIEENFVNPQLLAFVKNHLPEHFNHQVISNNNFSQFIAALVTIHNRAAAEDDKNTIIKCADTVASIFNPPTNQNPLAFSITAPAKSGFFG